MKNPKNASLYPNFSKNIPSHWQEIFETKAGAVYQSDKERCFFLIFQSKTIKLRITDFFVLQKIVFQIDIPAMATNVSPEYDLEIIAPCFMENVLILTLKEVLDLQEILEGTQAMLELHQIMSKSRFAVSI